MKMMNLKKKSHHTLILVTKCQISALCYCRWLVRKLIGKIGYVNNYKVMLTEQFDKNCDHKMNDAHSLVDRNAYYPNNL